MSKLINNCECMRCRKTFPFSEKKEEKNKSFVCPYCGGHFRITRLKNKEDQFYLEQLGSKFSH